MSGREREGLARDALLVAAAAVALYLAAGVAGFGFVNYDDDAVVQGNPVQSWGTLGHAFTERMAHAWLPLYALSLGIDNILFGPGRPGAYHLHSVLLHALNAALVLLLARRLGLGRGAALLAATLFAVHPAVSESVAWVASRKDLVSFALAACAALLFLRAEEEEPRRPALHVFGTLLLGLGMLAKGTVVVLPALLVLAVIGRETDPARRRRGLLATLPYFAVAAGLAIVHYGIAGTEGTAGASLGEGDTTGARVLAGLVGMEASIRNLAIPGPLSVEHGITPGGDNALLGAAGAMLLATLLIVAWRQWRRGERGVAAAALGIVAALAPFNGVFPRTSVVFAERYLYIPVSLACGLFGVLLLRAATKKGGTRFLPVAAVAVAAVATFAHVPVWRNSCSLWENAVLRAWDSPLARAKHGEALADAALSTRDPAERRGLFEQAAAEQHLAALHARSPLEEMRARQDAGIALLGAGKPEEALAEMEKARALLGRAGESMTASFRAGLEVNRAKALESCGKVKEAEAALAETVRGDPGAAAAWTNLGVLRMRAGNYDGAREALLQATKADPDLVPARLAMADLEEIGGDFETALRIAVKATESAPRDAAALSKAGEIAFLLGQPVKSADWYRRALAVQEWDALARRGLARALAFMARTEMDRGKAPDALRLATEATEADPDSQDGWFALGDGRRATGDVTGALEAYYRAGKAGRGKRAADSRAAIYAARALAAREKGDAAGARELLEKALAEGPSEIRVGGKGAPVKEGLDRIPPPPAGGEARPPLLDGVLAFAAGETANALAAFDRVLKMAPGLGSVTSLDESLDTLRPAALVLRSRARIAADDLDGSVSDLDTLCRESGKRPGADARARFLLGHTLAARAARRRADGKRDEAEKDSLRARAVLEEARTIDPALLESSLALAEMHFVEGRSVEAIRELNGVLAKDPDRVEAHLVLGNIMKAQFVETRDRTFRDQGEEHFRRALSTDPGEARAIAGLGEMEAFSNRPREAMNFALRALAVDPDLPAARALAATLYLRGGRGRLEEGNADGALEAAKKADALGGETASLCLLRSDAFRKKGDWRTAGAEVERARTLSPGDPEVKDAVATHYRDICYAFLLSKRRDQAEEALRRAEAAGSARVDLAEVRRLLERGPGAGGGPMPAVDPALAAALEKAAGDARRLAEEGAALFKDGKAAAAAEKFRASLGAYETAFGRFGLGLSLSSGGDTASAENCYRQATEDDPAYADAWLNLGALLFRRGADAEAATAYAAYLDHAPKSGEEETVLRVKALVEEIRARREKPPGKDGK